MAVAQMAANGCNQPGRYRWPPEPVQGCRRFDVLPAICPDLAPPKRYYTPHGRNTYNQYKPLHQPKSPPGASCPPEVVLYLYLLAQEPPVAELQRQLKGRFSKQPGGFQPCQRVTTSSMLPSALTCCSSTTKPSAEALFKMLCKA